jgi:very-short-patch-repair endonuclease
LMGQYILYNKPRLKRLRQMLRARETEAEKVLWTRLRARKLFGLKFYRQYSIGSYVADFYCPEKRLVIELDGGVHNNRVNRINDQVRTEALESVEIRVIRFRNSQVIEEPDTVIARLAPLLE